MASASNNSNNDNDRSNSTPKTSSDDRKVDIRVGAIGNIGLSTGNGIRNGNGNNNGNSGNNCIAESYFNKQGALVKNWKTRFFRLFPDKLLYYKDGDSRSIAAGSIGEIFLTGATLSIFQVGVYPGHDCCFGIKTVDSMRTYVLEADNAKHRSEWIELLKSLTAKKLKNYSNSIHEGFITKQGWNVKNWKRRYFVLTDTHLNYYPTMEWDQYSPTGSINLANGFEINNCPPESPLCISTACELKDFKGGSSSNLLGATDIYLITLQANDSDRTYLLVFDTENDKKSWLNHLKKLRDRINSKKNSSSTNSPFNSFSLTKSNPFISKSPPGSAQLLIDNNNNNNNGSHNNPSVSSSSLIFQENNLVRSNESNSISISSNDDKDIQNRKDSVQLVFNG